MFQAKRLVNIVRYGEEDPINEVDFNKLSERPAFQDFLKAQLEKK